MLLRDSEYQICEATYVNLEEITWNSSRKIYYHSSGRLRGSLFLSLGPGLTLTSLLSITRRL